ncbi:MAG: hypothetical protein M0019_08020 [Actinomycetota bacterium]|nr:hypothetical protein [Actinomycetota bacterium]
MRAKFTPSKYVRRGLAVVSLLFATTVLSSCGGASAGLGTSSSPCYAALPPAFQAVGSGGRMIGVRLLSSKNSKRLERVFQYKSGDKICLVAFEFPNPKSGKMTVTTDVDRIIGNFRLVFFDLSKSKVILVHQSNFLPVKFAHSFAIV